jgi:hypothetical protein
MFSFYWKIFSAKSCFRKMILAEKYFLLFGSYEKSITMSNCWLPLTTSCGGGSGVGGSRRLQVNFDGGFQ